MGTVPQSESTNLEVARGTIEQAMLSTGLTNLLETIQDPNAMAKATIEALQTGFEITTPSNAESIGLHQLGH